MIGPATDAESPLRWMTLVKWLERSGYSRDAFNGKRHAGVWVEGRHWIKSPDGKIQVDWREIENWMESNHDNQANRRRKGRNQEGPGH